MPGMQMKLPAGNTIAMPRTIPFGAWANDGLFSHLVYLSPYALKTQRVTQVLTTINLGGPSLAVETREAMNLDQPSFVPRTGRGHQVHRLSILRPGTDIQPFPLHVPNQHRFKQRFRVPSPSVRLPIPKSAKTRQRFALKPCVFPSSGKTPKKQLTAAQPFAQKVVSYLAPFHAKPDSYRSPLCPKPVACSCSFWG
jgi:hypothetical protein